MLTNPKIDRDLRTGRRMDVVKVTEIELKVTTRGATFYLDENAEKELQEKFGNTVKITQGHMQIREAVDAEQIVWFFLTLVSTVPVNLFSSWLYDKLKEQSAVATIDGQPIQDKEPLEKMLETILEHERE